MKELEEKFERLLVKTGDVDLINAYADLKVAINAALEKAARALDKSLNTKR